MTFYHPSKIDSNPYVDQGNGHWNNEPALQPGSNIVDDTNTIDYFPLQVDTNSGDFSYSLSSVSTSHYGEPPVPLQALYSPHRSFVFPSSPNNFMMSNSCYPFVSCVLAFRPMEPTPLSPISASRVVPTTGESRRLKISCPSCSKICTSWERAWTCFFNHIGARPFPCDGTCGVVGW
jgi:hypothetical protein